MTESHPETQHLINVQDFMTPVNTCTDIFKNENESVDLLLQEIGTNSIKPSIPGNLSINNSPTKPLNFPTTTPTTIMTNTKSYTSNSNNSSDTYTSENEVQIITPAIDNKNESFLRNFEFNDDDNDDSQQVINFEKTIQHNNSNDDDFSFVTPMTSTVELVKSTSSPSKSIMKNSKTPISSPKKNVVFTNLNPEIHHYQLNSADTSNNESILPPPPSSHPINHQWSKLSDEDYDYDSDHPPVPPPHVNNSFENLLHNKQSDIQLDQDEEDDDLKINEYKLKHDKFSNLSLNEKLDLFLSKHNENENENENDKDKDHSIEDTHHDLDHHLQHLHEAAKNNVTSNIYNLSLSLQNHNHDNVENPLNSLTKSTEVQLRSSGSSQSSLQSLREDNRGLDSVTKITTNKGIQLNDGIKGFSDEIVEQLIPQQQQYQYQYQEEDHDGLVMKPVANANANVVAIAHEPEVERFDTSINNTTEQSIMNLLKSASQSELNEVPSEKTHHRTESITKPILQDILVKDEPESEEDVVDIKEEQEEEQQQVLKKEPSVEEIKQESGKAAKLVESNESESTPVAHPIINQVIPSSDITEQDLESSQESTKMSIQFHMDSQWKLEDSHDGDKEDNGDTINDMSQPILDVNLSPNISASSQPFEDASDHLISKTLAPVRPEQEEEEQSEEQQEDNTGNTTDQNVLANSSNIAPPEEITLPPVETHDYSSLHDITKNLDSGKDSFEESLSAEHDVEKKPSNYLSIWHSQEKPKWKQNHQISSESFKSLSNNDILAPKVPVPVPLKSRKFKEVNVITRKVVNPEFEDLQVSGFLPELSDDSGFENHFRFLRNTSGNYSNIAGNRRSFTPLSTKNVLSNIDNDPNVIEPPAPNSNTTNGSFKRRLVRNSISVISATASIQHQPIITKSYDPRQLSDSNSNSNFNSKLKPNPKPHSKFQVPSFEIKRSSSILSPRNLYNDEIFADTIIKQPTIRSSGIKTLPSMDKDDVKRILNTKKIITQDDYTKIKLKGIELKKNSIVNEPDTRYDELQQQASIHNISPESSPITKYVIPHLANELLMNRNALLSKDQFFKENIFTSEQAFPEPDPELINSPDSNIFRTPPRSEEEEEEEEEGKGKKKSKSKSKKKDKDPLDPTYNSINIDIQPSKLPSTPQKGRPIKIGSPMKLIKQGKAVTGAIIPSSPGKSSINHKPQPSFNGDELINYKIREDNKKVEFENDDHQRKPSTISVPSGFTNSSRPSGTSSATLLTMGNHDYRTLKEDQQQIDHSQDESGIVENGNQIENQIENQLEQQPEPEPEVQPFAERGKLFFRVIGFKNINLPEIESHNAELSITLDNGVHSIKTPNYKLQSSNVLVGKEFELTVGESLQFILTMKMNYEKPKGGLREITERKVVKSKNKLGRMFGSKDVITLTKFVPFDIKDSWENKFAQDGSFARCYIDLEQFENKITGKALNFNLNCFNEWDKYIDPISKQLTKGKPYKIGQLEVKMLYIPRTELKEYLPTSIKSAYETIQDISQELNLTHEGYLYQEGGDCEIRKRRLFKLHGTSLIAHSEYSHKTRAKINLSKVVEIIYVDKENINNSSINYRNFSDVLLVEHAFKIRFANGEIIDFGAPNKQEKMEWITIFDRIIYRNKFRRQPWVNMMLQSTGYIPSTTSIDHHHSTSAPSSMLM